jgi:hypothetical protein
MSRKLLEQEKLLEVAGRLLKTLLASPLAGEPPPHQLKCPLLLMVGALRLSRLLPKLRPLALGKLLNGSIHTRAYRAIVLLVLVFFRGSNQAVGR